MAAHARVPVTPIATLLLGGCATLEDRADRVRDFAKVHPIVIAVGRAVQAPAMRSYVYRETASGRSLTQPPEVTRSGGAAFAKSLSEIERTALMRRFSSDSPTNTNTPGRI
jgi:hypothetical protein